MGLVFDVLIDQVKKIYEMPPLHWVDDVITEKDKEILKNESRVDNFDKLHLKNTTHNGFLNGTIKPIIKKTHNARIVILSEENQTFPWEFWGRIFQWLGVPKSGVWQIYIYSNSKQRILPSSGPIGPEHLNGGYTYPCNNDSIIIYRYEEATRVLIHELLHSACTDDHSKHVEDKEAATESWAELFLVALLSKGDRKKAYKLWKIQDHYIQDLNYTVSTFHNVNTPADYGARYTILRENVLSYFGIYLDAKYKPKHIKTSRFTSPFLDSYIYTA